MRFVAKVLDHCAGFVGVAARHQHGAAAGAQAARALQPDAAVGAGDQACLARQVQPFYHLH